MWHASLGSILEREWEEYRRRRVYGSYAISCMKSQSSRQMSHFPSHITCTLFYPNFWLRHTSNHTFSEGEKWFLTLVKSHLLHKVYTAHHLLALLRVRLYYILIWFVNSREWPPFLLSLHSRANTFVVFHKFYTPHNPFWPFILHILQTNTLMTEILGSVNAGILYTAVVTRSSWKSEISIKMLTDFNVRKSKAVRKDEPVDAL